MSAVRRRMTWADVTPMPGNPIYGKRVEQMRKEGGGYLSSLVGSPTIAENSELAFPELPEEELLLLDGGHRRRLAEEEGKLDDEFLADLRRGLTRAEMYRIRRGLNNRRTVKPAERFIEMAEEGDAHKIAIRDAVERAGWRISYDREPGGLPCTNELEWIWARERGAMVLALHTYEGVWGQEPYKAQARVVKALGAFWITYANSTPNAEMESLITALKKSKYTPDTLYAAGRNENEVLSFLRSVLDGIVYIIVAVYNDRRPSKRKLPGRGP